MHKTLDGHELCCTQYSRNTFTGVSEEVTDQAISSIISKKPARYRRAISYDSKEYYMRLASGNPAVFQDAIEENTVGETTQQEPEHGEDTIARVKG